MNADKPGAIADMITDSIAVEQKLLANRAVLGQMEKRTKVGIGRFKTGKKV